MYALFVYLCGALHDAAAASVGGKAFHMTGEDIHISSWASAGILYGAGVHNKENAEQYISISWMERLEDWKLSL